MANRAEILKENYQHSLGLAVASVLSETGIAQALEKEGVQYREVLYTPMLVLWAWISQVLPLVC